MPSQFPLLSLGEVRRCDCGEVQAGITSISQGQLLQNLTLKVSQRLPGTNQRWQFAHRGGCLVFDQPGCLCVFFLCIKYIFS